MEQWNRMTQGNARMRSIVLLIYCSIDLSFPLIHSFNQGAKHFGQSF